jgi:hypothetical protein
LPIDKISADPRFSRFCITVWGGHSSPPPLPLMSFCRPPAPPQLRRAPSLRVLCAKVGGKSADSGKRPVCPRVPHALSSRAQSRDLAFQHRCHSGRKASPCGRRVARREARAFTTSGVPLFSLDRWCVLEQNCARFCGCACAFLPTARGAFGNVFPFTEAFRAGFPFGGWQFLWWLRPSPIDLQEPCS